MLRLLPLLVLLLTLPLSAETLVLSVPTTVTNDADGTASAPWLSDGISPLRLSFDTSGTLSAAAQINSVTIRVTGEALDPSWRSEILLNLRDPDGHFQYWDFDTDLGLPDSKGNYDTAVLNAPSLNGSASGIFIAELTEDYNDPGTDNRVNTVELVIDYSITTSLFSSPIAPYLNGVFPTSDPTTGGPQPPATLSQTGAFSNLATLTTAPGLIPYEPGSPLWSDDAQKLRWIAIPTDGIRDSASEQVVFDPTAPWTFPVGTVAVKHFELPIDANNPALLRRLETRFLVAIGGGDFYGVTYRWRPDGTEADLLPDSASDDIVITEVGGSTHIQTWDYPGRSDCRSCHNVGSGVYLGLNTWQLNGDLLYPDAGSPENQLDRWDGAGLFTAPLASPSTYLKAVAVTDTSATLEQRVRSYLAANCSNCHNPASGLNTSFDLRFPNTLEQTGLINGSVLYDLGIQDAKVVVPQDPSKSILYQRVHTDGINKMPPIGRNLIHEIAATTVNQWIMTLDTGSGNLSNPPQANDDDALTQDGVAVIIDAFANDVDVDGDSFSLLQSTTPAHGSAVWNGSGQVTYTPTSGYTGNDQFTYQIIDTTGEISQIATIRIVIVPGASSNSATFTDSSSLLADPSSYSGVAMGVADMNQDGRDDIVRLRNAVSLFVDHQQANGQFSALSLGNPSSSGAWGMALGDADNNGFPDIISGGVNDGLHFQRANATGTAYTKTTLNNPTIFLQAINFADINGDGWLDIFPCNDVGINPPFLNTLGNFSHDASLINTTTVPTSDNSGNYGTVWTDYDGDGDPDLYISKCRGGVTSPTDPRRVNQLFRNNGNGTYTEVAAAAGLADGTQSWASDFADIDNDGDLDCFIGNHGASSRLMRNNGNGTFTNITSGSGITVTWDVIQTVFRDFNSDGWIDLLLTGEEHGLWLNDRDGTFTKSSNPFTANSMESCAIGDLNHDGFPDIYAGYASLYNSPSASRPDKLFLATPNGNGFLSIALKGRSSNALASGARLELHGPWGIQLREVRSGEGYGITHSLSQRFGLGNAATATQLVVRWPSGTVDTASNIAANQFRTLSEGDTAPPSLTQPGSQTTPTSTAVSLQLVASDPHNNTLTYHATNLPTGLTLNTGSGLISGSTASIGGVFNVGVSVSDGWSTIAHTFTWTVQGATNLPPTLVNPGNLLSPNGGTVTLALSASDPEAMPLTYGASNLPTGLSIAPGSNLISGSPSADGLFAVTITVSDGTNLTSRNFDWTISSTAAAFAYQGVSQTLQHRFEAEHFDTGGTGTSYFDAEDNNIGDAFRTTGVDLAPITDLGGGHAIAWIENREWVQYSVLAVPGTYQITVRTASAASAPGVIRVLLDDRELGMLVVPGTGDWETWQSSTLHNIAVTESGPATLRLEFIGGPYQLNWIEFSPNTAGGGGPGQASLVGIPNALPGRLQAENFDFGGENVAYHDLDPTNLFDLYRDGGVDITFANDVDDSFALASFETNEWTEYTVNPIPGIYAVTVRTAAATPAPGDLQVLLDGTPLATFDTPDTSGPTTWASTTISDLQITTAGPQVLRLLALGDGVNLNWIEFSRTGDYPGQDPGGPLPPTAPELLATAFGSWTGLPAERQDPTSAFIPGAPFPDFTTTFLIQLGGWKTETGYTTNAINYLPQASLELQNWILPMLPAPNPTLLPIPPAGYKYVTYRITSESRPEAYFRIELQNK